VVLGEETLAVRRRVLGEDHPSTVKSVEVLEWLKGLQGEDPEVRASRE
jgi:hypothetical protein